MKIKPNRILQQKALVVIEVLASDYLCENLCMEKPDDAMTHKLGAIYKYSHVASGHCGNPHKDWEEKLLQTYEAYKKGKVI